jgi:hypothetical protein
MTQILGLDVSKDNVTAHLLDCYPDSSLLSYWEKTSKNWKQNYPVFYANPKKKQFGPEDFLDYIVENKVEIAVLEPTGTHYSKLWVELLKLKNIGLKYVGHVELKRYRAGKKLQKNDASDSLALAGYYHDKEHWENGELNNEYFLREIPTIIYELRELLHQKDHLERQSVGFQNYLEQRLSWEWPEAKKKDSQSFYAYLSGKPGHKGYLDKLEKEHNRSISKSLGIEISQFSKNHAGLLWDMETEIIRIEKEIVDIIYQPIFKDYVETFNRLGMGISAKAFYLSIIFPFEQFLLNSCTELIEWETREVKKTQKSHNNGQINVKFEAGDIKRVKKNRSRDGFKMACGFGSYFDFSGDGWVEVTGGSSKCRRSSYLHILTTASKGIGKGDLAQEIIERSKEFRLEGNTGKLSKHQQYKLASLVTNILYRELKRQFCF